MPIDEKPFEAPKTGQAPGNPSRKRKPKKKPRLSLFSKKEKGERERAPKKAPRRRGRRRHGRMTLNYLLFGIVGVIILSILCYAVFFKVYKIDVTGDPGEYTAEEIVTASGVKMKQSLFSVDQKKINTLVIDQLPYVQAVNVHKKFPTTVELEVIPSVPVGAIETEGRYLYINSAGKILESEMPSYDKQKYPLIVGITVNTTQQGNYVLNQNSEQIIMLDTLLKAISASGMENINLIDLGNRLNMRIVYDNRLLVELGTEADLDYKLKFVNNTVQSNMSSTAQGVLDVTLIEKWGVFHEANIWELIEKDEQERLQSAGQEGVGEGGGEESPAGGKTGIQVDPNTGAIIVGPKDPLAPESGTDLGGLSSSEGEGASSSEPGTSSQPAPSDASAGDSSSSASSSSRSESSSSKEGSSKEESSSSSKESSSKESSSKGSSSKGSGYDKKDYLVV